MVKVKQGQSRVECGRKVSDSKTHIIEKGSDIRIAVVHMIPYSIEFTVFDVTSQKMGLTGPAGTTHPDERFGALGVEFFEETLPWIVFRYIWTCNFSD